MTRHFQTFIAPILLLAALASAQPNSTSRLNAKNEASPELRDARVVLLKHIRVIDGTGGSVKKDQVLVIQGGKIRALGKESGIKASLGCKDARLIWPNPAKKQIYFIVRGNPAEHIEDIGNVEIVFNNGVPCDPKTLLTAVKGQVGWK